MRIQDAYRKNLDQTHSTAKPAGAEAASAKPAARPASEDVDVKVAVSSRAKELAAASKVDQAKVDRLRQAISGGSFKVDSSVVARKLVGDEK